jgi:hypothetical protein
MMIIMEGLVVIAIAMIVLSIVLKFLDTFKGD